MHRIDYQYLRKEKAKVLNLFHSKELFIKEKLSQSRYNNATVLPLIQMSDDDLAWGRGGVIDEHGTYITDSGILGLYGKGYPVDSVEYVDESVIYCGYLRRHWGDFIIDCVSRLYITKNDKVKYDSLVFFVEENSDTQLIGNFKEFLILYGVFEKVKLISVPTMFKSVIIPELSYNRRKSYYSMEYLEIFDTIVRNALKNCSLEKKYDKIFLTRSTYQKSLTNEIGVDMLDDFFSKNSFHIISPEKMGLSSFIFYMQNANLIACISGTLPHNMLFAKESGHLIVIERYCLINQIQVDIDIMKKLYVTYIDANICLYPVEISYGPFVFAYNSFLSDFANENAYFAPSIEYLTEKRKKNNFKRYIRLYRNEHSLSLYFPKWTINYSRMICEAYYDGEKYFNDYIFGNKLYKFSQLFSWRFVRAYFSKKIKKR